MSNISSIEQNFINYVDTIILNHKLSHSYLIEVNNYDDDLSYIYSFIKMIFNDCAYDDLNKNHYPINDLIDSGSYPDLYVIEPDGNNIKKSQLIDLQKEFNNKSLLNSKRIYLIKNSEKLNSASANTILKFLEEPEDDIIAILLTDNRYHVIDTILSRCQILTLKKNYIKIDYDDSILDLLNCFIDPNDLFIRYQFIMDNLFVDKTVAIEKLQFIENIFISYLNDIYCKEKSLDDYYVTILRKIPVNIILSYLSIIEEEIPKLEFNLNFKLWVDSLFSKLIIGG